MSPTPWTTWDTDEMARWIANTQELYAQCVGRSPGYIERAVKDWMGDEAPMGFTVDLNSVDWTKVAP